MSKMTESELKAILSAEIADSIGHLGGELSEQRRKALDYYLGQPFGNEIDGRSKVVSTDVADTIEWILPSLLRIFTAGDDVVRYEPTGPEDEEVARQATEYANWKRFEHLSGSSPSNWLLANAPDVYLFGSLAEAAAYLGDDAHWPQWEQRYQLAVQQLQSSDDRSRWSAAAAQHPTEIQVS